MRFIVFVFWCFTLLSKPLQVEVKANSAVLMNADTGKVLYEKRAHVPVFPASTTKIATALFVLDEKKTDFNQRMKVSAESLKMKPPNKQGEFPSYWWYTDGTRMGLKEGEVLSLEALMHGMMMVSGNDTANVIAEAVGGSIPVFVEEMNQYLKKIGCHATKFMNPHGCHHPEHVTSAFDLCLMTRRALQIPIFCELVSKISYLKPKTNSQGPMEIKQTNPLLKPGRFYYPKAIGVKTGFHLNAQNTLVAAAVHEGRVLIAAVMGTVDSTDRYMDAIRLFEKAFSETKEVRRLFGPENICSRTIQGAKTELVAALERELFLSYFPSEEPQCRAFIYWENLSLPISKGQVVGELRILTDEGKVLASSRLLAKAAVKQKFFFMLKDNLYRLLHLMN